MRYILLICFSLIACSIYGDGYKVNSEIINYDYKNIGYPVKTVNIGIQNDNKIHRTVIRANPNKENKSIILKDFAECAFLIAAIVYTLLLLCMINKTIEFLIWLRNLSKNVWLF